MTFPDLTFDATARARPPIADPGELALGRVRPLRGPNRWRQAPMVAAELRLGRLAALAPADVPGFLDALRPVLPRLRAELGDEPAGSLLSRRPMGALLPAVVARLATTLQRLAGCTVGDPVTAPDAERWEVAVCYEEEAVGARSLALAAALVRDALAHRDPPLDAAVAELAALFERERLGPSSRAIVEAARRRGIPVRRLGAGSLVQLGTGCHARRVQTAVTGATASLGVDIARDKALTKRLLADVGLPVPPGALARDAAEAEAAAARLGYPVLLKPVDGNHGRGVSGRLADAAAVRAAWPAAAAGRRTVVVERFAEGRDHRVLVVGDRVVACAERVPAHVVGDGVRTVRALVAAANADPRRGEGHARPLTRLPLDAETEAHLARAGRTLDDVPAAGERVTLRAAANLSTGGTAVDRTDALHPRNARACVLAARAVGLDVAGIDVLSHDVAVPFADNGAVIVEVNAGPGLRMHTHPSEGTPRDVGGAIVALLYPPGAPVRVPVVAVTGTNGKTTTARLAAHLLRQTGRTVGLTTTDGVYVQEELVTAGDMTGPVAAGLVLANPLVEDAVLEVARGGLLRAGLGVEACDVGVVLNVSADHLGLRGVHTLDELAEVKAVIARSVAPDGWAVLNADDPRVLAMRAVTPGRVALLSTRPRGANAAFDAHVAAGGVGAAVEDGAIALHADGARTPLLPVAEVPLAFGGAAAFQLQNVLAAALAAHLRGVPPASLRDGLRSFVPSPEATPGRMNVLRVGRGHVVVDYAHNAAAVEALTAFVRAFDARRRIGVLAAPGDRRDDDIRQLGRLCACFDQLILKEDRDRRGRAPGEIMRLLHDGLREAGVADDAVAHVGPEPDAVAAALARLGGGDLAVVLAADVPAVLAQVRAAQAAAPAAPEAGAP